MHKILIENARFYAYHGFYEEENKVGGIFEVNLEIETDFTHAMNTDELEGTLDYGKAYLIIKEEMAITSRLLEHVAKRILNRLKSESGYVIKAKLKISKKNPPISGEIEAVSILIEE
jgi:dihydroneopterin aldolase